jgi:hypothetical protein
MASHAIETIITSTGILSDVITLNLGLGFIQVYTHGSTNTMHYDGDDVTAQRALEIQLVKFTEVFKQRGGNPFMGPAAGRYGDENDSETVPQRISQPGPEDIHGVFAGLKWDIMEVNDEKAYIELQLPSNRWKNELKNYYYFAAVNSKDGSEERESLRRLIRATRRRYANDVNKVWISGRLDALESLLQAFDLYKGGEDINVFIEELVDLAYPGEVNVVRRITIEQIDDNATSFLDEVSFKNISSNVYIDGSGYHTYFNALLEEIVMPKGFWGRKVPVHYDENLPDVAVRELNQTKRLDRRIFIMPMNELQVPTSNQIIYKDPETVGIPEVAIENWRQKGDGNHYPEKGMAIYPRRSSRVGIKVIVVKGEIPKQVERELEIASSNLES